MKVPSGWQLVPLEPTKEMRAAFHRTDERISKGNAIANAIGSPDYQWRAMLDAAPQPPST